MTVDLPDGFGGKAVGFARWRNEIEARLRGLEKATPSINRDQKGGTSTVRDPDGNVRLVTGQLSDGSFGVGVWDAEGNNALYVTDAGLTVPGMPGTAVRADEYVAVTSSTFVQPWTVFFAWASSDSVRIDVPIALDAGTNAEARLMPNWGSTASASLTASGGSGGNSSWVPSWKWQTPGLGLSTSGLSYAVQVRRTAGTGAVNVYSPTLMLMSSADALGATPTGV